MVFPGSVVLAVGKPKSFAVSRERVNAVGRASEDAASIVNGAH